MPTKYDINLSFFSEWNEESLYVLGYIYANGSISRKNRTHELTISGNEYELLEQVNKAMGSNYPIHSKGSTYNIKIGNREFLDIVESLGIISNNKLPNLKYPNFLAKNFNSETERHFLRGYIDGKASFYVDERRNKIYLTIGSVNREFLEEIRDRFVLYGTNRCEISNWSNRQTNYVRYYRYDTTKIVNLLYKECSIYSKGMYIKYSSAAEKFYKK